MRFPKGLLSISLPMNSFLYGIYLLAPLPLNLVDLLKAKAEEKVGIIFLWLMTLHILVSQFSKAPDFIALNSSVHFLSLWDWWKPWNVALSMSFYSLFSKSLNTLGGKWPALSDVYSFNQLWLPLLLSDAFKKLFLVFYSAFIVFLFEIK